MGVVFLFACPIWPIWINPPTQRFTARTLAGCYYPMLNAHTADPEEELVRDNLVKGNRLVRL